MRSLVSRRLLIPLSAAVVVLLPALCSACGIAESQAATGGTLFATFKEALQPPPTFDGTYVPILMYHRVEEPPSASAADGLYFVSPKKFRQQMRALDYHGYTPVTMAQVWDYWHGDGTLPEKPVVLTFDDGTPGVVKNAAPVLREYGWPAVLNVMTSNINTSGHYLALTPDMIRQLIADGWEIDSHSVSHPLLTEVSADKLRYELVESRRFLQEEFGVPADFFCYPGGDFDARVVAAVEAAGYLGAETVYPGAADPDRPFEMDRITVDGRHVIRTFMRDLEHYTANP